MTADFKLGTNLLGKILASGQVAAANTDTTVYTVPAASAVRIASASLTNIAVTAVVVSVSVIPSGGSADGTHKVVSSFSIAANDSLVLTEIVGAMLDAAAFVTVRADTATSLNYLLTGAVSS